MPHPEVLRRKSQLHFEALLLRYGQDYVAYRLEDVHHRERQRIEVHKPVAASRQLDHVARHRREPERSAVDQAQLPLLHLVDRPTPRPLQCLGQEENRSERRTEVVGHLHHQLQSVRAGEPVREVLGPVGFESLGHGFHGAEHRQQLADVRGLRRRRHPRDEGGPDQREKPARELAVGQRCQVGIPTQCGCPDGIAQLGQVRSDFVRRCSVLDYAVPVVPHLLHRRLQRGPQLGLDGTSRGTIRVPRMLVPGRAGGVAALSCRRQSGAEGFRSHSLTPPSLRWNSCLSISR